jgi:hypothetical protein
MAEVLKRYDFRGPGRPAGTSRWGRYVDGRIYRLDAADLAGVKPTSARSMLSAAASARGLRTRFEVGEDFIVVQAYEPTDDALPQAA